MAVGSIDLRNPARAADSLLIEGFRLMRERLTIYLAFSAICAFAAWYALPRIDMYDVLASHPLRLVTAPPVSVVLALALAALFFVLPSALRRIEPGFKMTALRVAITAVTLLAVATMTEIGYACAVLPGIVVGVLLSQALLGALLRTGARATPSDAACAIVASMRTSIALTRTHFATTFGIVAASLAILLVPFTFGLLALAILGVEVPPSLLVTAPLLFLTFIYFECVRYALIVRWYRRLVDTA